jgi:hypothetical protein
MNEPNREFIDQLVRAERERVLAEPPVPRAPVEPQTVHFSELPEAAPGRGATEWNFYRRAVGRLLAEGHEGRWVLIKGEEIIGTWDTEDEANRVRVERFLTQDVLMKQICTRERVLRGGGYFRRWR